MVDEPQAAPGAAAEGKRLISEAEAEIKKLGEELFAKIHALAGDVHFGEFPVLLADAKLDVESAIASVAAHFKNLENRNG